MDDFTKAMVSQIQKTMLKHLSNGSLFEIDYHNRPKIPGSLLQKLYQRINMETVLEIATNKLEEKIADKIIVALSTEFTNDIKQIMSNRELREELRAVIRQKLKERTHD